MFSWHRFGTDLYIFSRVPLHINTTTLRVHNIPLLQSKTRKIIAFITRIIIARIMSAVDSKRSWLALMDESEDDKTSKSTLEKRKDSSENCSSRKKSKPNNNKNDSDNKQCKPPRKPVELETDPLILQRRQKQIDYGKNTVGYHNYTQEVAIDNRTKDHPRTPDKYTKYSRRSWDALIKLWRKKLHAYDTDAPDPNSHTEDDYEDYITNDDN